MVNVTLVRLDWAIANPATHDGESAAQYSWIPLGRHDYCAIEIKRNSVRCFFQDNIGQIARWFDVNKMSQGRHSLRSLRQ